MKCYDLLQFSSLECRYSSRAVIFSSVSTIYCLSGFGLEFSSFRYLRRAAMVLLCNYFCCVEKSSDIWLIQFFLHSIHQVWIQGCSGKRLIHSFRKSSMSLQYSVFLRRDTLSFQYPSPLLMLFWSWRVRLKVLWSEKEFNRCVCLRNDGWRVFEM